jgi:hypothetical protein
MLRDSRMKSEGEAPPPEMSRDSRMKSEGEAPPPEMLRDSRMKSEGEALPPEILRDSRMKSEGEAPPSGMLRDSRMKPMGTEPPPSLSGNGRLCDQGLREGGSSHNTIIAVGTPTATAALLPPAEPTIARRAAFYHDSVRETRRRARRWGGDLTQRNEKR